MPESYGLTTLTAGGANKQLIARHTPLATRGILLTGGVAYLRGCLVQAPTAAGPFVKCVTATPPLDANMLVIVSQDIDLTALGNMVHIGYVGPGEFIRETVLANSGAMDAPTIVIAETLLTKRGMNLVRTAYGDITDAV